MSLSKYIIGAEYTGAYYENNIRERVTHFAPFQNEISFRFYTSIFLILWAKVVRCTRRYSFQGLDFLLVFGRFTLL